ncbi:SprB repeat-containing protein, partial [Flavobacterium pectinovorum]|uniref:SprB repeat-containing protein n=1 Tax=Flavobacterium pectinovorum TaxID=29533 RepID=UPI001FAD1C80
TASTNISITEPSAALSATATQVNANCNVATSKVTVTATGGTPGYTYSFVLNNAGEGTYSASNTADLNPASVWDVWVKDANGCTFKLDLTIAKDAAPTLVTATGAGCLGTPGGYNITAVATGGTGTLSYSINGGASYQASNVFPITSAGTYIIRVKDTNECTIDSDPVIVAPQLTVSAVLNKDITCNPAPTAAQITVNPTGGVGPFTYTSSPNTGTFAGNVFTTSTPGNYTFTVTDTNTCSASTTTAIVVTPTVNPDITGVSQTQSINCSGDNTAAIDITIDNTQGLAPFVFTVLNTTTGTNYGTQTSGLAAGNYTITVRDAKGCTNTENINISQPNPIVVDFDVDPISCGAGGVSLGRIIVNGVTGGTPNYTYHVTGVGYNQKFTNQPGNSQVFDIVDFGLYELIVTDANGCQSLHQNILVASPPDDLDITVSPSPVVCSGTGSAVVAISPLNTSIGAGPFYFSLYTGSVPTYPSGTWLPEDGTGSKKTTFNNLIAGVTYTFVVYDANAAHGGTGTGCYYYETSEFPIGTNSTIKVDSLVENNITCKGSANGNVTFTMNHTYGVATPVTYQIYNSQSVTAVGGSVNVTIPASGSLVVNNFGSLPFGNYFVLITEAAGATNAGCSATSDPFDITESAIDLSVTASKIKNVNCNEDGVIAAQAKDGTAPYTYQYLLASATAPTASTTGWAPNTTFGTRVTGNYIVYAKDAYGCIKTATVTLNADDAPVVIPPTAPICYDGTAFTITFSGTVDPDIAGGATYSVNGSTFQSSPSFTFNAAGTYNLVIKDGNGCTANVDYEVYPKLNLSASLTKELDCTSDPEAEITLTTTGGNTTPAANYSYEVSFNSGAFGPASNPYLAATTGNYVFRVTDLNNTVVCQTTTSLVLDPITPTVFTTAETNVSCKDGLDGTITVNVTSGVGPYEYQLDGGTFQSSNVFKGLADGTTYTITVKDAKSCLYTKTPITITEPSALLATAAVTPFGCNLGNVAQPAVVTVTATAGTGPYKYKFNGSSSYNTDNTLIVSDNGTVQTITYSVEDAHGCIFNGSTTVDPYLPITDITFTLTTAPVCPGNVADVTLAMVGGYSPVAKYEIISPAAKAHNNVTDPLFTGLETNITYLFRVTDSNGCSIERNYTVAPVTPIAIDGSVINHITCNDANGTTDNGSAKFTVSGFSASRNYTIGISPSVAAAQTSHVGDVITLTGLASGTYTVTVTDDTTNCSASADVTIVEPAPIAFTAIGTKVFCSQEFSTITVSAVTGGTGAYTYAVVKSGATAPIASAYSTSAVLSVDTNLTDLVWDVYVKDANGCIHMDDVTITHDAPPTILVPAQQCYVGSNLTVDLSPNTLTTTYNGTKFYTLNGSALAGSIATFTAPGTYSLGIKDDNGCEAFVSYTIREQLLATATLTKDLYCAAPVNATIDVAITGGVGTYNYQMYVGGTATGGLIPVTGSGFTASVSAAGTYTFEIIDSNSPSCSVMTTAVVVNAPATPLATAAASHVSCQGSADGTITVTPSNGVGPYTYVLTGTGANTTGNATGIYTDLRAGSYSVVVTDSKGCVSLPVGVTINEPSALLATAAVTPFGCNLGNVAQPAVVTVTATAGTGPYKYKFNGSSTYNTDNTLIVSDNGTVQTITYSVEDAHGCIFNGSTTVDPYLPITDITFTLTTAPVCPGNVADVTLAMVGGYSPVAKYEIISPAGKAHNNVTNPLFTGLETNITYLFKVTDSNGCSIERNYTVAPVTPIAIGGSVINHITCNDANGTTDNGSAKFTVSGFSASRNYTIGISPSVAAAQTSHVGDVITLTGLASGTYTVTVTDNTTNCSASADVTIVEPAPIAFTAIGTKVFCSQEFSTITVSAVTGGTGAYTYAVVKSGATAPIASAYSTSAILSVDTNLTDLVWDVYVKDANGCIHMDDVTITHDAPPTILVPAQQCYVGSNLTVDLSPNTLTTTHNGTKFYTLNGSALAGSIATFTAPGTYSLGIKDDNGCEAFVS